MSTRLATGAAVVVVVMLLGVVALGVVRERGGTPGDATPVPSSSPATAAIAVSATGVDVVEPADLRAHVLRLVGPATAGPPVSPSAEPGLLLPNLVALRPCLSELTGAPSVAPVAVDLARVGGGPALVVVLAREQDAWPTYLVRTSCEFISFTNVPTG